MSIDMDRISGRIFNLNKLLITWYGRKSHDLAQDIGCSLTATAGPGQGSQPLQAHCCHLKVHDITTQHF